MNVNDRIIAVLRTAVPAAIGWLIAQAIAQLPTVADWIDNINRLLSEAGVPGTVETLLNAVAIGAVVGAYYWLVRQLGVWFPRLRPWIERIGLGSSKSPSYGPKTVKVSLTAKVNDYLEAVERAKIEVAQKRIENLSAESDGFQLALDIGKRNGMTAEQIFAEYQTIIRGAD